MPQKSTRQPRQSHKSARKSVRKSARKSRTTTTAPPIEEHHHYYSKMVFDGKNIMTESQKDDEPVKRRVYTMKQLEREIPIGAELLRNENIHTVPRGLQYPIPRELGFRTVLPNPADLGLLPPSAGPAPSHVSFTRSNRKNRHRHRSDRSDRSDRDDLKLIVRDTDANDGHQLFQLPAI